MRAEYSKDIDEIAREKLQKLGSGSVTTFYQSPLKIKVYFLIAQVWMKTWVTVHFYASFYFRFKNSNYERFWENCFFLYLSCPLIVEILNLSQNFGARLGKFRSEMKGLTAENMPLDVNNSEHTRRSPGAKRVLFDGQKNTDKVVTPPQRVSA